MLRQLASSTVVRLVAIIFLLQVMTGGAAIVLLRARTLQVIEAERTRQIVDLRDDLQGAFYQGGRAALQAYIAERRGSLADPLIFVALTGAGAPVLSHVVSLPPVATTERPLLIRVDQAAGADAVEALVAAADLADGSHVVVGALTTPDRRVDLAFAEALAMVVLTTGLLALGGALITGMVVSRRAHAIAKTAEALAAGDFGARYVGRAFGDGFDHLGQQINYMAERIDRLVSELQSVAGGLAHDLRSPVARLRAAIETAQREIDDGPAAEALQLALADAEALEAMLATALELARLEAGSVPDRRESLDLLALAEDMVELYEPLAEQDGVALSIAGDRATVWGDRELISRALANLIDNALKYGGDRIEVRLSRHATEAVLAIADNGAGIATSDRDRAMERFTRLDNARTRPGAGLGLAMVAAVARLHDGRLALDSGEPAERGLVARLHLPLG